MQPTSITHCSAHNATSQYDDRDTQELLTKFWVQEELPSDNSNQLTVEERNCEEHFLATHLRDSCGRYIVRIPIKSPLTGLGKSYDTAHQCLQHMLKNLSRDETLSNLYNQLMKNSEELNHMVKAPSITQPGTASYYLPHHWGLKPDSTTTKLRVVFNGSSPSSTGKSINDLMHTRAHLLSDISDVLIWIRHYRHIFATDIMMMYQVKVHEDHWDLQRILWIDDELRETAYQVTSHIWNQSGSLSRSQSTVPAGGQWRT